MMFGTWLAVAYAVPRQVADTVCAKTSWRPKPTMFDTMVIVPMSTAARAIPPPACGTLPVFCARPASVAVSCASVTGGWQSSPAQADAWPGPCSARPPGPGRVPPGCAPGDPAAGMGRRPSMSSQCSGGVRWMTLVKLTFSLAAVSAMIPASTATRPAPRQARRRRRAEHGPERVGPRVAEHGPLPQVLPGEGQARTQRDPGQHGPWPGASRHRASRHRAGRHGAVPGRSRRPRPAGGGQQPARQRRDLDRAAGPQIEQVEQVGAARDQAGVDRHVQGGAAQQPAGGDSGRADSADLDRAGGHLAVGQGAQVTAESPPVAAARQVVVTAEGARPGGRGHQRSPDPGREAGGERGRERGPGGGGRSLQQGDRLAAVISAGPGRRAARRPRPQQRVRAPGRPGRQGGADHARGGAPRAWVPASPRAR